MLVTIAVAAAAVAQAPAERPEPQSHTLAATLLQPAPTRPAKVCEGDARMIQAAHERGLYRFDPNDRAKRLMEMPLAQGCLLGGTR